MTAWWPQTAGSAQTLGRGLLDLVLPNVCVCCEAHDVTAQHLCDGCNVDLLSLVALPYCPRCGATIGPNIPIYEEGCSACPAPLPRFVRAVRLGPYAGPLRTAVRQLKYRHVDGLQRRIGRLLSQAVASSAGQERFDVVVPVPPHWRRRLARGCDHTLRLARPLARAVAAPVGPALVRVRHTPPQTRLSRTRRVANIRGAFKARDTKTLTGANVLLVDDVTTTGATAGEAARTLLEAGALRVTLAVVAKGEAPTAYAECLGR